MKMFCQPWEDPDQKQSGFSIREDLENLKSLIANYCGNFKPIGKIFEVETELHDNYYRYSNGYKLPQEVEVALTLEDMLNSIFV